MKDTTEPAELLKLANDLAVYFERFAQQDRAFIDREEAALLGAAVSTWEAERAELRKTRAALASAANELRKWREWHPDDETMRELQAQAKKRDGEYGSSLAACVVYIGALETRTKDQEAALERARALVNEWKRIASQVPAHLAFDLAVCAEELAAALGEGGAS